MLEIIVCKDSQLGDDCVFRVDVSEGDSKTQHFVDVTRDYYVFLTDEKITMEELVQRSFVFLLEREPKESILRKFNLKEITYYFPEYEQSIKNYF